MLLHVSRFVPRFQSEGGAAGSQAGSQARTRAGSQRRSAPVKRMFGGMRDRLQSFGEQERGSGTDAVAGIRRRSPASNQVVDLGNDILRGTTMGDVPTSMGGTLGGPERHAAGGAPVTDPNQLDRFITRENTLRNQRLGFGVDPMSLEQTVMDRFQSALPQLNEQFQQQAQGIAQRTAALGRTGSGMVDREFADLNRRQQAARENLLGRLTFQGAQQDVGTDLQTQLARQDHLRRLQQREDQLARSAMGDRANQLRFLQRGMSQPTGALQGAAGTNIFGAGEFGANAGGLLEQLAGLGQAGAAQQGGIAEVLDPLIGSIFGGPQSGGGQMPSIPDFNPTGGPFGSDVVF